MSDHELTTMLDDVAASIRPRPDFDAVAHGGGAVVPMATSAVGRPFRRTVAVAAASVMLLGGIAAAAYPNGGDDPGAVSTGLEVIEPTTSEPTPSTVDDVEEHGGTIADGRADEPRRPAVDPVATPRRTDDPAVRYSAELGEASTDPLTQVVLGTAAAGERVLAATEYGKADAEADDDGRWALTLRLDDAPAGSKVGIRVTFEHSDEVVELVAEVPHLPVTTVPPKPEPEPEPEPDTKPEPEPEPEPEPDPVEFTAFLGSGDASATPMKQVLHGTATPGTKVLATTAYGHATATAGEHGGWELALKLYDVPAPSAVRITVSVSTGGPEFEFWVERPAPEPEPEPEFVAFTAERGQTYFDGELTKVVLYGTGQPGSGVLASSEFGAEDARVGEKGRWELHLRLWDVPAGHEVVVRVTNNASEAGYEFVVHQPEAEPEPEPIDFTADAALAESDRTPPVNEYWGTSTAGAKITISSEYGGTTVTSDRDGKWDARVEFPAAPVDVTFIVRITSSKGEAVYEFPFTRRAPG